MPPKQLKVLDFLRFILVRVAKESGVPVEMGDIFNAPHEVGEERVGDGGDQNTDGEAAPCAQAAGQAVGLVMELPDNTLDASPSGFGDTGLIMKNGRDGLDRDLSGASDIRDGSSSGNARH